MRSGPGNGQLIMSFADTMRAMGRKNARFTDLKDGPQTRNRSGRTREKGMWHTVMDDLSTYPESS
jgi:rhamnogalacturonyl hydrolase YesR